MTHNQRSLEDASFIKTDYFPTASGTTNTPTLDLGAVSGDPDPSKFDVQLTVAAAANHVDGSKYLYATLQHSDTDSGFATVAPLIRCDVIGVVSTGSAETTFTFRLPPGIKRYVSFLLTSPSVEDNTGVLVTTKLLF